MKHHVFSGWFVCVCWASLVAVSVWGGFSVAVGVSCRSVVVGAVISVVCVCVGLWGSWL